jgi:hypothetical protein
MSVIGALLDHATNPQFGDSLRLNPKFGEQ